MAEPVTIGGQTFIKTGDGWVDQKSKIRAPEGLLKLLNNLQSENSLSEGKKKRVRIDLSRPVVKLGKTEYVWDLNGKVWIDKKTREASNPRFSLLIEATYQSTLGSDQLQDPGTPTPSTAAAKAAMKDVLANNMFATNQKTKTSKTGSGTLPSMSNIKINSPIVQMIEKLATIDGYLKQKLDNQKKIAGRNLIMAKETAIEAKSGDASPVEQASKNDAEKSDATGIGVALLVGGLIAAQFEPVQEAFKSLASGIKSVFNFVGSVAKTISDGLDFFTGSSSTSNSSTEVDSTTIPDINQGGTPSSPSATSPVSLSIPSETNKTLPSDVTPPSSSTPTPEPANNSRSTKPASTSSGSRNSTRINDTSGMSSNSGSRSSAPSPTRSSASPSSSPPAQTPTGQAPVTPATPPSATPAPATTRPADATKQTEQVGSSKPSDILQFTARTGSEANFRGLPPDFQKALLIAGAEYKQTYGEKLIITSARRSPDEQQRLLDEKAAGRSPNAGGVVAGKYSSPHVKGTGVDIGQAGKAANILAKQGIIWQAIPGDEVHYNYKGPGAATDGFWGSDSEKDSVLGKMVSTGVDLTEGAIKAVGNILSVALGDMSPTTGSQLQNSFNSTMSSDIGKAAREKTNAIVDSKIIESAAATIKTSSADTKASASSSQMQIAESTGDNASIQYYLTRMGFAPLDYKQAAKV